MFTDSPHDGRFGVDPTRWKKSVVRSRSVVELNKWLRQVVGGEILTCSLDVGHKRKLSTSRAVALVIRYTTGYFVTRRRNLSRAPTGRPGPTLSRDLACRTVQYPL